MSVNKVMMIGRMSRDPMFRHGNEKTKEPNERDRVFFTLCVPGRKPRDGSDPKLEWVPCTAWAGTARAIANNCSKGKEVHVEGRLNTYRKDRGEGQDPEYRMEVTVLPGGCHFLRGKKGEEATTDIESAVRKVLAEREGKAEAPEDNDDFPG